MKIHFIDVGMGNMVLIQIPKSKTIVCDCNITEENKDRILKYLATNIGEKKIDIFINTHRDADHMRGIKLLDEKFGITTIWDSGVPGTTTDSSEYKAYMELRKEKGKEIEPLNFWTFGEAKLRVMNGKNDAFSDANEQSLVVKLEYGDSGVMLAGDTNYKSWKEFIVPKYDEAKIKSEILLASHHGSITFFDDPSDEEHYYVSHIKIIDPAMTLISVGDNDKLPNKKAVELYKKYSRGSSKKNKVYTTKDQNTMLLILKDEGGWNLKINQ